MRAIVIMMFSAVTGVSVAMSGRDGSAYIAAALVIWALRKGDTV